MLYDTEIFGLGMFQPTFILVLFPLNLKLRIQLCIHLGDNLEYLRLYLLDFNLSQILYFNLLLQFIHCDLVILLEFLCKCCDYVTLEVFNIALHMPVVEDKPQAILSCDLLGDLLSLSKGVSHNGNQHV